MVIMMILTKEKKQAPGGPDGAAAELRAHLGLAWAVGYNFFFFLLLIFYGQTLMIGMVILLIMVVRMVLIMMIIMMITRVLMVMRVMIITCRWDPHFRLSCWNCILRMVMVVTILMTVVMI